MPFNATTIGAATTGVFGGSTFSDTFDVGGSEVNMIALDLTEGQFYEIDIDNGTVGDFYLRIFDEFGVEVRANDDGNFANDNVVFTISPYLRFTPNYTGRYYVAVSPWYLDSYDPNTITGRVSGENPLALTAGTLTVIEIGAGTWGSSGSINAIPAESSSDLTDMLRDTDGSLRVELVGSVDTLSDLDMVRIDLDKGDVVVIDVNGTLPTGTIGTVLRVFDDTGVQIGFDDDSGFGEDPELVFNVPVFDDYYIGVTAQGNFAYNALDGTGTVAGAATGSYEVIIHRNPTQIGSSAFDSITGEETADYIVSLSGNDTLNGGDGRDTLAGGDDQDQLFGGNGRDQLYGEHGNDSLAGGNGQDVLSGGLGDDEMNGGAGKDISFGGAGNDRFVISGADLGDNISGGADSDLLDLSGWTFASIGWGVNLQTGVVERLQNSVGADGIHTIDTVEHVLGSDFSDSLTGDGLANSLSGGGGNDTINGGTGADIMRGGGGNDLFIVDVIGDAVDESAGEGTADRVMAAVTYVLAVGVEVERMTTDAVGGLNAINLTGNALEQLINGNAGANVLSAGAAGAVDRLVGYGGNDTYRVFNAGDIIVEAPGGGTGDRVITTVTFSLAADDDIEFLNTSSGVGVGVINLTGNSLSQVIIGNAAGNIISGGAAGGVDTLNGLVGDDIYRVFNAGDIIIETAGNGIADRVNAAVSFNLASNDDIEIMATNSSAGLNAINLRGNALDQSLFGNAGANRLNGSGGADTMTGALGADVFIFQAALGATNIDTITDYNVAADRIEIDNAAFVGLALGPLAVAAFTSNALGTASAAAHRIIYETDTGFLWFDADGTGAGARIQFADLAAGLAMAAGEFTVV